MRFQLGSSHPNRVQEHRITASLDVNPTYGTAAETGVGFPSRQNSLSPDSPPKSHSNLKPRSELDGIPIPSREYAEIYEDHVPPSLVGRAGDGYQNSRQHSPSDEVDVMIPNREYAEICEDHVLPPFQRLPAGADHKRAEFEQIQAPSWEYAEISESPSSLTRTFSVPPIPGGGVPLVRRPSNPECTWQRKISKESTDDSSLHIYQEVQGLSRSPSLSPKPSPRTVFMESLPSSTGPEVDEEESYYSSISEEDLRRYHWCTDLEQVGETSETGTGSTYNTAADASCEALAETDYMEDNPHITVTATDSAGSSRCSSSGGGGARVDTAAPSSEAMRELRELLDCLGTESDGNVLTGERSIAKARQLLVREMGHAPENEA